MPARSVAAAAMGAAVVLAAVDALTPHHTERHMRREHRPACSQVECSLSAGECTTAGWAWAGRPRVATSSWVLRARTLLTPTNEQALQCTARQSAPGGTGGRHPRYGPTPRRGCTCLTFIHLGPSHARMMLSKSMRVQARAAPARPPPLPAGMRRAMDTVTPARRARGPMNTSCGPRLSTTDSVPSAKGLPAELAPSCRRPVPSSAWKPSGGG